ncbi:MAG: DUF6198 family protein [Bacillota bacterium]|jgi:uncharacterized membrane protein YczE
MSKKEITKRYIILLFGMLFISFGIALITKADLGTSPISAIPYSLSLILSFFTLGNWTIIFNLLLILVEIILLKGKVSKIEILVQFGLTFLFGYCIDLSMFLLKFFNPESYLIQIISLLIGCCILSFGAYLQVIADVAMLPGDAYIRAIVKVSKKEFGTVRVLSDTSMTITAGIICLIFLHELAGVREGTVIASLIVGNIIKIYCRQLTGLTNLLLPENRSRQPNQNQSRNTQAATFVLTISRQFGTGGREIGKKLAEKLHIAYYDSDSIQATAAKSGYISDYVVKNEKSISNILLYDFYSWYTAALNEDDMPKQEQLFLAESKVIRETAARESCVIVGRLSGHILKAHPNSLHIFIHSDTGKRIQRIMKRDGITAREAAYKIQKVDKERANYYRYFANAKWGDIQNYDLTVNSGKYGIDQTVDMLYDIVQNIKKAE